MLKLVSLKVLSCFSIRARYSFPDNLAVHLLLGCGNGGADVASRDVGVDRLPALRREVYAPPRLDGRVVEERGGVRCLLTGLVHPSLAAASRW